MNWQPIDTAPKDGSSFLAVDARVRDWQMVIFYDAPYEKGSPFIWSVPDSTSAYHKDMFTHWMPLPEPPSHE